MKRVRKDNLLNELAAAGASRSEALGLSRVVNQLTAAPKMERSKVVSARVLESIFATPRKQPWFGWLNQPARISALATIAALVVGPLAAAQAALPGQPLYPLKRATETAVTTVLPTLKQDLPVRRSSEVKQLIQHDEHRDQVESTLKAVVPITDDHGGNQPGDGKDDQVKQNLKQAKEHATESEKQAIDQTIKTIDQQQEKSDDSSKSGQSSSDDDVKPAEPQKPSGSSAKPDEPIQNMPVIRPTQINSGSGSISGSGQNGDAAKASGSTDSGSGDAGSHGGSSGDSGSGSDR